MTNQEINMMIAGIKGIPVVTIKDEVFFAIPGWPGEHGAQIDYINDWNLLGPLEDELYKEALYRLQYSKYEDMWKWTEPELVSKHGNRGMAACLAYIKEFGSDK